MGTGTEVAKNAGRMILSDDNFATIVFAVEQGRKIYDNLTKYIRFVLVLLVVFVLTFLGATLFNIAAASRSPRRRCCGSTSSSTRRSASRSASTGRPLGSCRCSPRPRGQSVLTRSVMVTVGLGRAGHHHRPAVADRSRAARTSAASPIGQSIAFTSFALCLIVAAVECRSETETVLTTATFDSKQMNWAMLGEFVLAVLVTQMDVFNRLLGTTEINLRQFALGARSRPSRCWCCGSSAST